MYRAIDLSSRSLSDMWRELYALSPEEQCLITQCLCHLVLWHTVSHRIIIFINSNIISLLHLTLRKSKLILFRLSLCLFLTRSLGFKELFSNSPLSIFGKLSRGQASGLAITRAIWSEWTQVWWPPWNSLVLSAFGHLSQGPASRLTVPRTVWSEWTWSGQSPLAFKFHLESLFRMFNVYCIVCIYCIFLHSDSVQFFSLCFVN
jgi:hypothetical protein